MSSLFKDSDKFKVNNKVSYKEREILMYQKIKDKKTGQYFMCYDGEKEFQLSKEFRNDVYNWKTKYILVDVFDKSLSLIENYNQFIEMADNLKL